jgi:molecular chaperone GrpE
MPRPSDGYTNGAPAGAPAGGPTRPGPAGSEPPMPGPSVDPFAAIDEIMQADESASPADEVIVVDDDPVRAAQGERDEYRDALQRLKAEFDNYRKRTAKAEAETRERASEALVVSLLPVLDACDAAIVHDAADVGPISKMLLETLEKQGLEAMVVEGQPFDPVMHEAVLHEPGDGGESVVTESMRTGYVWKGRVLRPAMVKVKG